MSIYHVPGIVQRVIDGDTIVCDLDLGWSIILKGAHIRVAGINAPEISTDDGKKSAARTTALLPAGTSVQILSHSRDKYGRVLADVFFPTDLKGSDAINSLGSVLLNEKLAVPFMTAADPETHASEPPQ